MIVLICTALLAMLTGSFLLISRSNSSLAARGDDTMRATQNCLSGLDYVRTRVQTDRTWGESPLGTRTRRVNEPGLLIVEEAGTSVANNQVDGSLPGRNEGFQARLVNNLLHGTPVNAPAYSRRSLDIPPKMALVVVDGYCDNAHRHLEVLLRNDFFASSPLTSGADLALTLANGDNNAKLAFTTPLQEQNSVKSRGKTYVPVANRMNFGANPNSGSITGKDDVMVDSSLNIDNATGLLTGAPSGGISMRSSPAQKTAAENASNSTILPSRDQRAPQLDSDSLKQPTGTAKSLPAGKYVFTGPGKVNYFSNPAADPNVDPPTHSYTGGKIYDNGATSGSTSDEAVSIVDFHFIPLGKVESPGSLTIESNRNYLTPQLSMGYAADGSVTRQEDSLSSLKVQGDLTVRGNLAGNGSLIAKGSGIIELQGKTQLAQSPDAGVAIYAEKSVRMRPPSPSLNARSDIFDKNDFDLFRRSIKQNHLTAGPPIGDPQSLSEWVGANKIDQRTKVGNDDQLFANGLGTSSVIRDQGVLYNEYVSDILPNLPGYAAHTTPLGRPLTADEQAKVDAFLSQCENGGGVESANQCVTIGRHVRIKEFLRSCDRQVGGDTNWLTVWPNGAYNTEVQNIVMNLTESLFEEAEKNGQSALYQVVGSIYTGWGDKDLPDVSLRGIVYAGGNFYASTSRSFKLWGAIASHDGPAILEGLHLGDFHFDQDTLEKLLDLNKIPLIPVNWAMETQ